MSHEAKVRNKVKVIGAGSWGAYITAVFDQENDVSAEKLYGISNVVTSEDGDTTVDITKELLGVTIVDYHMFCDFAHETVSLLCVLPTAR